MKKEFLKYLQIAVGSFALALGVVGFLEPNSIATGGTAGLAIVFHEISHIPIGILFFLINIPLLAVGFRVLGKRFAIKTVVAIFFMTISIDVLSQIIHLEALSDVPLLSTLYGGVLVGVGLGLIFRGGGSAGGGTIIAKILAEKTTLKPGAVIMILDSLVILSAALVFSSLELALWSLISIFTTSKLVDLVITGRSNEKILHISSYQELSTLGDMIHTQLGLRGTIIKGNNLDGSENKDVIFIVVNTNRIAVVKELTLAYDKDARIIVMQAKEIMGSAI